MNRSRLNLIIDVLLLLGLGAITGIGLLVKYVLVPGRQRWEIYGRNVELTLWSLDRHQWGTIHFYVALAFAALIVLHIVLHWSMVVGVYRRWVPSRLLRGALAVALAVLMIVLVVLPLLLRPGVRDIARGEGRGRHGRRSSVDRAPPW